MVDLGSQIVSNASAALSGTEAITGTEAVERVAYSLGVRALAEFVGMAMVIYTGESALANELLASTKGHGMGWGWTVFTFGFAFLPPLQAFQLISAKLNPAMCLAQAIWGNITWLDCVVLSAAELAGAILGAVLHWLHFYPHWRTTPEPPALCETDGLLRCRDVASDNALRFASYNTRKDRVVKATNPLSDLRYRLGSLTALPEEDEATAEELLSHYFKEHDPTTRALAKSFITKPHAGIGGPHDNPLARRTLQVADLHHYLAEKHVANAIHTRTCPSCANGAPAGPGAANGRGGGGGDAAYTAAAADTGTGTPSGGGGSGGGGGGGGAAAGNGEGGVALRIGRALRGTLSPPPVPTCVPQQYITDEHQRALALYKAALVADQNLKLSIFATRPAINAPLFNLLTEAMGTAALILIALLIELQARRLPEPIRQLYVVGLQPLLITFSIVMLISGLGGPTSYAANPARDLGPRIAHWLLPIPNKGRSEWVYAWIPVVGPLIGGAVAGGLYIALEQMTFPGGAPNG